MYNGERVNNRQQITKGFPSGKPSSDKQSDFY
jgi:hypothetical protein